MQVLVYDTSPFTKKAGISIERRLWRLGFSLRWDMWCNLLRRKPLPCGVGVTFVHALASRPSLATVSAAWRPPPPQHRLSGGTEMSRAGCSGGTFPDRSVAPLSRLLIPHEYARHAFGERYGARSVGYIRGRLVMSRRTRRHQEASRKLKR